MKRHDLLLPYRFKTAGWVILGIGVLTWVAWLIDGDWDFSVNTIRSLLGLDTINVEHICLGEGFTADTGLMQTLTTVLILIGAYLAGFSRCKDEDEFTEHLRYRSLTVTVVALMAFDLVLNIACWGLNYLYWLFVLVNVAPIFYVAYFHILVAIERRRNEE